MWEQYKGVKVKVVQVDGWIKYGLCVGSEGQFLSLRFDDGRVVSLSADIIVAVEPIGGGRDHAR